MFVQTPDRISAQVRDLCRQINPNAEPVYIAITPEPGSRAERLFRVRQAEGRA